MLRQYSASQGSEPQPACCIMRIIRNVMRVHSPARGGVCAVEWSENVAEAMEGAIRVTIGKTGESSRRITIEGGENLADFSL